MAGVTKAEQARISAGGIRNAQHRGGELWFPSWPSVPVWSVRISLPYDPAKHSKNRAFYIRRIGKKAAIGVRDATQGGKDELAQMVAEQIVDTDATPVIGPLYLGIFLQKRNWQADAVNLLDIASDAVQLATGINDRWYSVAGIEWEMTTDRPMFYLHLAQMISEDHDTCSYCASIVPLSSLYVTSKKRVCSECDTRR